ncbi:hypothetical protein MRX96_059913 [Rhipicephalus microplus]
MVRLATRIIRPWPSSMHASRRLKTLSASVSSSDAKCRNRTKLLFIQFIQELIRLAGTCSFGAAATTNIQDQTLQGLRDPNLVHSFIRMEDAFTVQKALEHAKKEECIARVGPRQPSAVQYPVLQGYASSPTSSPLQWSACFRCGSPHHWANFPGCSGRRQTCKSCGKQGHFSRMCHSSDDSASAPDGEEGLGRTVTNAITVLSLQGAVNGIHHNVKTTWTYFDGTSCKPWPFHDGLCPAPGNKRVFSSRHNCHRKCMAPRKRADGSRITCQPGMDHAVTCSTDVLRFPYFATYLDGEFNCFRASIELLSNHHCLLSRALFSNREDCRKECMQVPTPKDICLRM